MQHRFALSIALLLISMILSGCAPVAHPRIVHNPWENAASAPPPSTKSPRTPAPETAPQVQIVGRSVFGEPIRMYTFPGGERTILIFGGIHGNEPTSVAVAKNLITTLTNDPSLTKGRTVVILPNTNPDGIVAGTRTNANEVDVNRNFPASNWQITERNASFGGMRPSSEPETLSILRAIEISRPRAIISIHSIARGRHGNNFDGPAEHLAELLSRYNGYNVLPTMGYPTPGSFGTWAGVDRDIPTITLELPREASGAEVWQENRQALLAVIERF